MDSEPGSTGNVYIRLSVSQSVFIYVSQVSQFDQNDDEGEARRGEAP